MTTKLNFKQIILAGAMAAAVSLVINALLFLIFHSTGTISDDVFVQPNQPLTILPVIMASIIPSLIGASVFFLFEKFSNNGFKIFSIVSIILMLLSFASPFTGVPGISNAYAAVLCAMHAVVALVLLYFIKKAKV
jgi:Family of unknown function (DUF6069)